MGKQHTATLLGDVALRLRASRIALDRSQTEVCAALGIARNRWGQWEHGRSFPAEDVIARYCDLYAISLDWLYRGQGGTMAPALVERCERARQDLQADDPSLASAALRSVAMDCEMALT